MTNDTIKLSDYYLKNRQDANKNVVTNSEGKITTEDKPTNANMPPYMKVYMWKRTA